MRGASPERAHAGKLARERLAALDGARESRARNEQPRRTIDVLRSGALCELLLHLTDTLCQSIDSSGHGAGALASLSRERQGLVSSALRNADVLGKRLHVAFERRNPVYQGRVRGALSRLDSALHLGNPACQLTHPFRVCACRVHPRNKRADLLL